MNLKKDFYYAVLECTQEGYHIISMVTKKTWDTEALADEPDLLVDYAEQLTLQDYSFESSGMNGDDCLDIIERLDGKPVDGQQLIKDLQINGYSVNVDFAKFIARSSMNIFTPA